MGMTFAYFKTLTWDGDKIGIDSKVSYKDQNGIESGIDIKKFIELAEQCKVQKTRNILINGCH